MEPIIYPAQKHGVTRERTNNDALRVIDTLQSAGFVAYLVGGGVRDLIAGTQPKDFDISTSAEPEEIKRLFRRNCILIGRRFRLAHIRYGSHILEVSTFRSGDSEEGELIVRDNTWGTPEEDVLRRDFTINGLFYDPSNDTIIDYVGGVADIENHLLRTIGVPEIRFQQDPVRMVRLLKFVARYGFAIDPPTLASLEHCHGELSKSSPARLLEETFRMLESGAAEPFFRLMHEHNMLHQLFPWLTPVLNSPIGEEVYRYLAAADTINKREDKPLNRATLANCLIFPILHHEIQEQVVKTGMEPKISLLMELTAALLHGVLASTFFDIPRRIRTSMQIALHMQYRFTPLTELRIRPDRLARSKEFIYACELLKVRAELDPDMKAVYEKWKPFIPDTPESQPRRRPRRNRRNPRNASGGS